jgi:hypothetical protein
MAKINVQLVKVIHFFEIKEFDVSDESFYLNKFFFDQMEFDATTPFHQFWRVV